MAKNNITKLVIIGVLVVVLVAANVVAGAFAPMITKFLSKGPTFESEEMQEALEQSDKLCTQLTADSIVMLKNQDDALPLEDTNINVFGYGATDQGFLLRGVGSGSSTISQSKRVTLLQALAEAGFSYNQAIIDVYNNFARNNNSVRPSSPGNGTAYRLAEPALGEFEGLWNDAYDFSGTAIFVISRDGGENIGEIPKTQTGNANKTYLDITDDEQAMLDVLGEKFDKVIVLLNTTNTMHLGFLEDENVSAALYVGLLGQSGTRAIASILKGDVNPSGKTTDIITYSSSIAKEFDPTFPNNEAKSSSIAYVEDIYYGYKWYETADYEGYFDQVSNTYGDGYEGVVQFPFGYGLSYTTFEWSNVEVSLPAGSELAIDSKITVKVMVTNTGDVAGKDVVELYATPPYTTGEIEKAHNNLIGFAKTVELAPGQSQIVEIAFDAYALASYDCYDKNNNGFCGYELDQGEYQIKLMRNSHDVDTCENNTISYTVSTGIKFETDPFSGEEVVNRYTGQDAYLGVPTDGSTAGINVTYLSRSDFKGTWPKAASAPNSTVVNGAARALYDEPYADATMPTTGQDNGLYLAQTTEGGKASFNQLNKRQNVELNMELLLELGNDFNNEKWEDLLDQLSLDDLTTVVHLGGFGSRALESVGKVALLDFDGPAGFNMATQKGDFGGSVSQESWTAYPSEALIGCSWNTALMFQMGISMGAEAQQSGLNGWYAPGINLHRSAYTARNFEYYSEDAVLSGKLAANVVHGAKATGLTCYIKHFVVSEEGPNPRNVNTWLTEQNLRENYLRAFEIAVKEGKANAIMSAFNRVGPVWAGANHALLNEILRGEWGFRGVVLTDWSQGEGLGGMNPRQGVRAGNDTWLNPSNNISGGLEKGNAIDMHCARIAAKNVMFAWANTLSYATYVSEEHPEILEGVKVSVGTLTEQDTSSGTWWIPVLVGIDVVGAGGLGFWAFTAVKPMLKKKPEAVEGDDD